jgi:ferredoxin-NADP reductase
MVTDIVRESSAITSIHLAGSDREALPAALPGQYLTVRLPVPGGAAAVRNYSISSAPGAASYRISVKRDGAASTYLHDHLVRGDVLEAAAPRGDFVLTPGSDPVLLLSAGVGITPLLAMLHQLAAEQSSRQIWWIHTAHNSREEAFARETGQLAEALPHARRFVFHTRPDELLSAVAESGRLTRSVLADLALPAEATAYLCGPASFMDDVREALVSLGVEADRIRSELFGSRAAINPGVRPTTAVLPHQPPGPPGSGPTVTFARSGLSVRWREDTKTLLELAEACGIPTRWACRSGVCHTCTTPLLAGSTVYDPSPLEDPPAGEVLVCSAQPETDVVLDQ